MSRAACIRTGWILLLTCLSAGLAAGQTQGRAGGEKQGHAVKEKHGRVAGFVIDAAGKTPIPQANVVLANTALGAVSGKNGAFYIERVPPGTYQLVVTMLGYRKMIIKDVAVRAGAVRALRVSLNRQAIDMGKVQVEAKREAQAFQYEKSIAGHEIITPRFIARRPGALEDAYRALNVLPGVTARSDLNTQ
ncbi:MAG TPA: carboxypeptidase-like regulatory domain-containing protein, partial [bacterium]|nr:carboxypeptidase-like regulatory domain-containing protein [bacterium]